MIRLMSISSTSMPKVQEADDLISVIITVLNGAKWIDSCMKSIVKQTAVPQSQQSRMHEAQTPFVLSNSSRNTTMTSPTLTSLGVANTTSLSATSPSPPPHPAPEATSSMRVASKADSMLQIEICVFDDCSCDNTFKLLCSWQCILRDSYRIRMHIEKNETGKTKGVGYGRNRAIEASRGNYLCFQDIDDEMLSERIAKQYALAKEHKNAIIGSKFIRIPSNATCRFTNWANNLSSDKLTIQIYTSNGPTIIMPTWMCHREVYNRIKGGFSEEGQGCPEDLIFFYKHLDNQGVIKRVDECLLHYRYHNEATTFTVTADTIWHIRLKHLVDNILQHKPWSEGFSIWNAGKQGRKFFRNLPEKQKQRVKTFCDVDKNKINKCYSYYDCRSRQQTFRIPIVHFSEVQPPIVVCMKLDLTNGAFEMNLQSLKLVEGKDYILFT
uniref:Glycosyltransferase 2-like domain-containing protein n=1 Tax=Stomoxys calcitrans TaxID=35570 RepID=A0A1I8PZM2_STOCA